MWQGTKGSWPCRFERNGFNHGKAHLATWANTGLVWLKLQFFKYRLGWDWHFYILLRTQITKMCIKEVTTYPLPYDHDLKVLTKTPQTVIIFVYFLCTEQKVLTALLHHLIAYLHKKLKMEEKGIYNTK